MSKRSQKKCAFPAAALAWKIACCALLMGLLPSALMAKELKILSSIEPVNKLVAAIAGEKHTREVLLRKNQSVHNVSFKPSQIKRVADADVVFWVGPMLEAALGSLLSSDAHNAKSIRLATENTRYLKHGKDVAEPECAMDWHECDPHIWFSALHATSMVAEIAQALIDFDPENTELYTQNLAAFEAKANASRLRRLANRASDQANVLVLHNGWQYLGLPGYQVLSEHGLEYVGGATALELEQKLRSNNVACVLAGPMTRLALVESLASDLERSAPVLVLDPMGSDFASDISFFDYLQLTRRSIEQCSIVVE